MNAIAEELRRIADIADAGDKPHWAQAMRAGAMQIENWQRDMEKLREERDAAFAMSKCECETNECCANLMLYRDALYAVQDLAGWHTDDEADADDASPDDMVAHTNGLIRKLCKAALMGSNVQLEGRGNRRRSRLLERPSRSDC